MVQGRLYGTIVLGRRNCFSLVRSRKYGAWSGTKRNSEVSCSFSIRFEGGNSWFVEAVENQVFLHEGERPLTL